MSISNIVYRNIGSEFIKSEEKNKNLTFSTFIFKANKSN